MIRKMNKRVLLASAAGLVAATALVIAACSSSSSSSTGLTYAVNPAVYTVGTAITSDTPTLKGGTATGYTVSPALPAGLALDATTGIVSGTPTAATAAADYTVTASTSSGSFSVKLNITVTSMDTLLGGTGSDSIAVIGGGTANKLWIMDAHYHRNMTSIWGDGNNSTTNINLPRATGAHQWNYPDLHDTHAIAVTKDFSKLYTLNWFSYSDTSYMLEFDPKTLKETRRIATGRGSHHLALSPDDHYAYVANQYDTTVSIIDLTTWTKVTDLQVGAMAVYPSPTMYWDGIPINSKYMFVTVTGAPPIDNNTPAPSGVAPTNAVVAIDMSTNTIAQTIPIGTSVHGVNLTPDAKEAWVAQPGGESSSGGVAGTGDVTVIDANTLAITHRIKLGSGGIHIVFDRTNKYAFVTGGSKLYKVDRSTYSVVWSVPTDTSGAHLAVSPDNNEVWTLNHGFDTTRYPYLVGGLPPCGVQVFSTTDGSLITEMVTEAVSHEIQFMPRSALGTPSSSTGTASSGVAVYTANCQVCHAVGGAGAADVGAPALNSGTWANKAAAVQSYITTGNPSAGMPAFGTILSSGDLAAVSQYVASLTQ